MNLKLLPLLLLAFLQLACVLGRETNFPSSIQADSDEERHRIVREEFGTRGIASATEGSGGTLIAMSPQLSVAPGSAIAIDPDAVAEQNCQVRLGTGPAHSRYFQVGFKEATKGHWFKPFDGMKPMNGKNNIPWKEDLVSYKFGLEGYRYDPIKQIYELRLALTDHPGYYGEMAVNVDPFLANVHTLQLQIRKGDSSQSFEDMPVQATFKCNPRSS